MYVFLFSQENQKDLNQNNDKENDPKFQADGKLVGEINPDNFTYEIDFMPKVKTEIKQENSKPKEEKLPLDENDANKPQFDGSNTISNSENAPIRHGNHKFGCPFCPKLMQNPTNMKLHIRLHTGEKPFSCKDCGKSFTQKAHLARHTLIHTGELPFECKDCGKSFNLKQNLDRHTLVHTQEKPFICNECGKRFNHRYSLKNHVKTDHSK